MPGEHCGREIDAGEVCSCRAPEQPIIPPPPLRDEAPFAASARPRVSRLAIAGVCLGLVPIVGVIGAICGIIALIQIVTSRGQLRGMPWAVAAITLPVLVGVTSYLFLSRVVVHRTPPPPPPGRITSVPARGAGTTGTPAMNGVTKDAVLTENLAMLRGAIEAYRRDCGAYPTQLVDLVADPVAGGEMPTAGVSPTGDVISIPAGCHQGPYLSNCMTPRCAVQLYEASRDPARRTNGHLPYNPYGPDPTGDLAADVPKHWSYVNGVVHPAVPVTGTNRDGVAYQKM